MNRLMILLLITTMACDNTFDGEQIPLSDFPDLSINLSLPEYRDLNIDGSFVYINSIGLRGIILYRENASSYFAFERNCSFQPNDACATVNVSTSKLSMTDPCCGSTFNFPNGDPTGGPARYSLRIYETQLDGNYLTITDTPVN
jgi:nitrite reductase/ring-hydroxylating ferredoxin subunit